MRLVSALLERCTTKCNGQPAGALTPAAPKSTFAWLSVLINDSTAKPGMRVVLRAGPNVSLQWAINGYKQEPSEGYQN
jgi:hypothetical protein